VYTSRGVGSLAFGSRPPNGGIGPEYRPSYALALTGSCVGLTAEEAAVAAYLKSAVILGTSFDRRLRIPGIEDP